MEGCTPLCYICEHILTLCDIHSEHDQYTDVLTRVLKIMLCMINHCPSDALSENFHIIKENTLRENLLLPVHDKLTDLMIPVYRDIVSHRVKSIILGTDQDHRLFVEQLLSVSSWKLAITGLCNTDFVDVSNVLVQCLSQDPHASLLNPISSTSDLSRFFVLTFYCLATNVGTLRNVVSMCHYSNESVNALELVVSNFLMILLLVRVAHKELRSTQQLLNVYSYLFA